MVSRVIEEDQGSGTGQSLEVWSDQVLLLMDELLVALLLVQGLSGLVGNKVSPFSCRAKVFPGTWICCFGPLTSWYSYGCLDLCLDSADSDGSTVDCDACLHSSRLRTMACTA